MREISKKQKLLLLSISIIVIVVASAIIFGNSSLIARESSDTDPKGIRLTVINDPTDSIVITWYTGGEATDPKVKYSINSDLSDSKEETASSKIIDTTFIYSAEITDLKPNTTYFYRVYSDTDNKAGIYNFSTAAKRDMKHVEFLVLGDTQSLQENTIELMKKALDMFGKEIDFVIHMGDVVNDGISQSLYNDYFYEMEKLHRYKPCFFTEGNHENGAVTKMYDNIPLPSNGIDSRYYSFSWGPASFLSLNDNGEELLPYQKMSLNWLESQLATFEQEENSLWKFAYYHQPIINAMEDRGDKEELKITWLPLFESYGVDIVFQGHNHYYQRTYPMSYDGKIDDSDKYNFENPKYPMYITCNSDKKLYDVTGGNSDYELPDYVTYHNKTTHFTYVEISVNETEKETTLSLETWAMANKETDEGYEFLLDEDLFLIDSLNITKDLPKKYTNSDYEPESVIAYTRMPEAVYLTLYFSTLGLFIVIFDRPIIKRYVEYKHKPKQEKSKDNERTPLNKSKATILFLVLSIILSAVLYFLDILDTEIALALGPAAALLLLIPIRLIMNDKVQAKKSFSHLFLYLSFAAIVVLYILGTPYFFYLWYLSIITLAGAGVLTYGANYLSKNIKPSRISGEESFYLAGTLMIYGILLIFFSAMNLIALF